MHFDAIVVGSGFGGSVMAYRLAQAGKRVCLLERGKAFPPGSFPRTPDAMSKNFWSPRHKLHGMFDVWSFRSLAALVASGLGGGSLIYANVHIRKDEKWFVHETPDGAHEDWPVTREQLDPHYTNVEAMLDVHPYPFTHAPYSNTAKTRALKFAGETLAHNPNYKPGEIEWFLPNLAVTFGNQGETPVPGAQIREAIPNLHGLPRSTCRLCGECNVGCNYGSKNTLDYTYLSAAKVLPTPLSIFARCEVKSFRKREGARGYEVHYLDHSDAEEERAPARKKLTCDKLILAAGALGSPYLLLKNRANVPGISELLGTRFNGNGDILGTALKCRETRGGRSVPRRTEPSSGPVISSALRVKDALDGGGVRGRGFYVEDAGFPAFFQWMAAEADLRWFERASHFALRLVKLYLGFDRHPNLSQDFSKLVGEGLDVATLLPLLSMGRELPSGRMSLTGAGDLEIDWRLADSADYFARVRQVMKDVAASVGGEFIDNPLWHLNQLITVHPIGGCPMGRDAKHGVVGSNGQVFGCDDLYVADGSVMPGPVGPNPALTIAAVADYFADQLIPEWNRGALTATSP